MKKLNVFITIDTELWLLYNDFKKDLDSALYGITQDGDYGIIHQLDTFKKYNLNATFFVEPLFTLQYGQEHLKQLVTHINNYNQEIGLHIHTEWFNKNGAHLLSNKKLAQNIKDYTEEEQTKIIAEGLTLLKSAGAQNITSFRAGNYGGNFNTLKALKHNGLLFDATYNAAYLNNPCDMDIGYPLQDVKKIEGVFEYPVTFFNDYGNHKRHLQLTACSLSEIKYVLNQAYLQQRDSCTIVLHSFEWIKRIRKGDYRDHKLDKKCLQRFHGMCEFLTKNKDKFITQKYQNLIVDEMPNSTEHHNIQSNTVRTLGRMIEQLLRKL